MRIVVSGTHASGKSTLISDFAAAHPDFEVLGDPFEAVEEMDAAGAALFAAQLEISAARLLELPAGARVIAERGPLDFLAYLDALDTLRRPTRSPELFRRGIPRTATAMTHVDLLVLLPLSERDAMAVGADEDLDLREAMNDALRELADDGDLVGDAVVVELTGAPHARRAQLDAAIIGSAGVDSDPPIPETG